VAEGERDLEALPLEVLPLEVLPLEVLPLEVLPLEALPPVAREALPPVARALAAEAPGVPMAARAPGVPTAARAPGVPMAAAPEVRSTPAPAAEPDCRRCSPGRRPIGRGLGKVRPAST
jgi:hypothetical protein